MASQSAGLLVYRRRNGELEVFLVHPGGPFWANKDAGAWSIPKGEYMPHEDPLTAARREFMEETGVGISGEFVPLVPVKQKGGKVVTAWAVEGDCDPALLQSYTFEMKWPPRSGKTVAFPEVDRAQWFTLPEAMTRLNESQAELVVQLQRHLVP